MTWQVVQAWEKRPPEQRAALEQARLAIPSKRRPTKAALEITARVLAGAVLRDQNYTDLTYAQIIERAGAVSEEQVKRACSLLHDAGVFVVVRKSTRGKQGKAGRAPRRVPAFLDLNHGGVKPPAISDESRGGNDRITGGLDPNHGGVKPPTLNTNTEYISLESESAERARPESANSHPGEKETDLPAHMTRALIEQITSRALEQAAAQDPTFKPGKAWFISRRGEMLGLVIDLVHQYPQANRTALEQAAALALYNELDPYKHPDLIAQLEDRPIAQPPQNDLGDLMPQWAAGAEFF